MPLITLLSLMALGGMLAYWHFEDLDRPIDDGKPPTHVVGWTGGRWAIDERATPPGTKTRVVVWIPKFRRTPKEIEYGIETRFYPHFQPTTEAELEGVDFDKLMGWPEDVITDKQLEVR